MALPKNYLTSTRNTAAIFAAIQQAQAPKQFTNTFLQNLGYKSSADRLIIGILKSLGFLTPDGSPTARYFEYLDQTQSARILADGIREAYSDLFALNTRAEDMSKAEVKGKLKTLTQGSYSDDVLGKMANTFVELVKLADFSSPPEPSPQIEEDDDGAESDQADGPIETDFQRKGIGLTGLVYAINIQLPESRDPAVYDALFRSLRTHLIDE